MRIILFHAVAITLHVDRTTDVLLLTLGNKGLVRSLQNLLRDMTVLVDVY
jgi:hypothetical protein